MHETEVDNKWRDEGTQSVEENGRREVEQTYDEAMFETQKAQLVMLMRLYDIQMALLTLQDAEQADKIYDAHDQGKLFNPQLFIPGE